jgi:dTDP-4-dehydrorhamnose reductase
VKILVVGAQGMLGTDLVKVLSSTKTVVGTDIKDFDITRQEGTIEAVSEIRPDFLVNVAAFTQVDQCEKEEKKAMAVNGEGVRNLALACLKIGAKMMLVSTDYIFDGRKREPYQEEDTPNPLSVYGRSKLLGEHYLQERMESFIIVRTAWLYGANGPNFVKTIVRLAQEREELKVVDDQCGTPTYSLHLARAINALIETGVTGIFHVTNRGFCTWYEFACEIVRLKRLNVNIRSATTDEIGRPAKRPPLSVLDCSKFEKTTTLVLPHWKDAVKEFIEQEGV